MTEEQEKLLKYAETAEIDKLLPFFEVLEEIRDILSKKEMPKVDIPVMPDTLKLEGAELVTIKGKDGETPTDEHLLDLIKPLIPEPIKGEDADEGRIIKSVLAKIPTPKDGEDGDDAIVDYDTIINESTKKVSDTLTPLVPKKEEILSEILKEGDKIIESINTDEEKKIKREKVEGLDEELTAIRNLPRGGGNRRVKIIQRVSLTSQVDGNTRDFLLPRDTVDVVGLWGTSAPITFDPADWTLAGQTLTLGASIITPPSGQTLVALVETLFY